MVITFRLKLFRKHILRIAHLSNRASHHFKKTDDWIAKAAILAIAIFAFTSAGGLFMERGRLAAQSPVPAVSESNSAATTSSSSKQANPTASTANNTIQPKPDTTTASVVSSSEDD